MGVQVTNIHIYNVLYLLSGLSFTYYFYCVVSGRLKRWIIVILGMSIVVYFLFRNAIVGDEQYFDSMGYVVCSIAIIIMIFLYYHSLLNQITEEPLSHRFDFWFISSQFIYYVGSFGIFLTFNYLTRKVIENELYNKVNRRWLTYLWGVHNVLLAISVIVTGIGLMWVLRSRSKARPRIPILK